MFDPADDPIKTRPDGSIDMAYYLAKGRQARSDAAAQLFRRQHPRPARRGISPAWGVVVVAVVLLPVLI